jgi:hypothetical protein
LKCDRSKAARFHESGKRVTHIRIIIDDGDYRIVCVRFHDAALLQFIELSNMKNRREDQNLITNVSAPARAL